MKIPVGSGVQIPEAVYHGMQGEITAAKVLSEPRTDNNFTSVLLQAHNESGPDSSSHYEEFEEYNKLVKLYQELPRDLFVPQLIRMYSSCESDLERESQNSVF